MTLRTRLALGILAMVVVMLAPLILSLRAMDEFRRDAERLRDVEFRAAVIVGRARTALQDIDQTRMYLSLFPSPQTAAQFQAKLDTLRLYVDSLGGMTNMVTVPRMRNSMRAVQDEAETALRLASAGRAAMADSIIDRPLLSAIGDVERILTVTEQSIQEETRDRVSAVAVESETARRSALFLLAGAAVLAVLIGLWLTQSVSGPIDELDAGMRAVSEGDFGHPLGIDAGRRDEFGRLAASYNSMAMQLRELDRLKAEFVSVASHELKTPINVITGYLQLLKEHVYGPLTDRQNEVVDTLAAQGKALSRLVRGLLDVSRFEAGGGRIDPRTIALPAFLGDLERTFRVLAIQRDVSFEVARENELPAEVVWDPEQMNEVLGNLLSNAFKFTTKGGLVRLRVRREGDQVQMTVSDTGAGIPAAQLPYVFEKFYTADNQTTGLKGTGLGLAIAKGIVGAHGGSISVQSSVGSGTAFTILLPLRALAARVVNPRTAEASSA
ncbi:MAG: HAMP domain-containing histidine kinase [Gemmatimonadaceae bacterium]|nr:HAMP domain-containing histidine kinase [Gemmatimonadaceae bacterium]